MWTFHFWALNKSPQLQWIFWRQLKCHIQQQFPSLCENAKLDLVWRVLYCWANCWVRGSGSPPSPHTAPLQFCGWSPSLSLCYCRQPRKLNVSFSLLPLALVYFMFLLRLELTDKMVWGITHPQEPGSHTWTQWCNSTRLTRKQAYGWTVCGPRVKSSHRTRPL